MNETTQTTAPAETTDAPATKAKKEKKAKPAAKKATKKTAKKGAPNRKAKAGDGIAKTKGPGALKEYAPGYTRDKEHKTPSGNPSVHCNDEVAKQLLGKDLDACYKIAAKALKVDEKELRTKYAGLNLGMQRMNLGNRIRGALNAK